MLKSIEKLKGVQEITKSKQLIINGGNGFDRCFFISCRDDLECIDGRCVAC